MAAAAVHQSCHLAEPYATKPAICHQACDAERHPAEHSTHSHFDGEACAPQLQRSARSGDFFASEDTKDVKDKYASMLAEAYLVVLLFQGEGPCAPTTLTE